MTWPLTTNSRTPTRLRWVAGLSLLALAVVTFYATRHYVVGELLFGSTFQFWHLLPFALAALLFVLGIAVIFWGTGRFSTTGRTNVR
jgi:hypothetical protein